MQAIGKGIMPDSPLYFHTPSNTALQMYFYPLCVGNYHCDKNYVVSRRNYDSFLLLHVLHGSGYTICDNIRRPLKAGDFALIDCYQPHIYGSEEGWDILWVHYDGPLARQFFNALSDFPVLRSKNFDSTVKNMYRLFNTFHQHEIIEEVRFNKYLTDIMTTFLMLPSSHVSSNSGLVEEIRSQIAEHPEINPSLDELAKRANLSPYYFLRLFKKETGYTPHEYLILSRIHTAKFYLKTSTLSIKEIAFNLGFSSESAFCTCFKKSVGYTPNEYRLDISQ